jgi:adenosine deaminase
MRTIRTRLLFAEPRFLKSGPVFEIMGKMFRITVVSVVVAVSALGQTAPSQQARMERKLSDLRKSPPELYDFLYRMPKGGDLHNHLSGAVYAETFLKAAADDHDCIDKVALAIVAPPCKADQVDAALTQTDNDLRNAMIDSLSMRNFVAGKQSGHDHFFATFGKFGPVDSGELIAEVVQRAGEQNESYLELMALSGGGDISDLGKVAGLDDDFDVTRQKLESGGLTPMVAVLRGKVDRLEQTRRRILGCQGEPQSSRCRVQVHYVYQVLREFPKEQVFAQVLAGFALATTDPRVVAVNFVQPGRRRHFHARLSPANADGRLCEEDLSERPHYAACG